MAHYDDVDALRQLADRCDVLTYEFENVDADGLDAVIKKDSSTGNTSHLQNRIFKRRTFFPTSTSLCPLTRS